VASRSTRRRGSDEQFNRIRFRYVARSLHQSARGIGRGFEFGRSWQGAITMAKKKKKAAKKVAKKKGKK
jgi:hypothetical protein